MPADRVHAPRWGTRPWRAVVGAREWAGEGQAVLTTADGRAMVLWGGEVGGQPTWAAEAGAAVALDGTLYHRGELAGRLGLGAATELGDAELALAAWRRWGTGCVGRLRGVFGLLVWDAEQDTLLLVRDAMGMYPLWYAQRARVVVASTWLEPVVGHPEVPCTLNRAMLAEHLALRWSVLDDTFYESVQRVPPGHSVRLTGTHRCLAQWWDPTPTGESEWLRDDPLPAFGAALERAVARASAYGPSALFLSGGLDSVSVAAVAVDAARRADRPPPLALSLAFPGPEVDETAVQVGVAGSLGMELIVQPVAATGDHSLVAAVVARSAFWSQPILSLWLPSYEHLALDGTARGVRAILTGGGGDDWLTVNPAWLGDLLRRGRLPTAAWLVRSLVRSYRLPPLRMLGTLGWRYGLRPLLVAEAVAVGERVAPRRLAAWRHGRHVASRSLPAWLAPDPTLRRELAARLDELAAQEVTSQPLTGRYGHYLATSVSKQYFRPFLSLEQEEFAELGRRVGVPIQAVYQDADLVELLARVPPERLLAGSREKGLVREAVSARFPALGFTDQRKLISVETFRRLIVAEGPAQWSRLGGPLALRELGVVSADLPGGAEPDALYRNRAAAASRLLGTLCLEAWVRPRVGGQTRTA